MYCCNCHYSLAGLTEPRCPECGHGFVPGDATTYLTSPQSMGWLHVPVGLAIVFGMVGLALYLSGAMRAFVDPIPLIWIAGVLVGGLWLSFGPATVLRAVGAAIVMRRNLDRDRCATYLMVFGRAYQLAWGGGLVGLLLGLIVMLANLNDPSVIGPAMAVALLPVFYGALLAEFIFAPLQQAIASRGGQTRLNLPLLALPFRSVQAWALAVVFAVLATVVVFLMANL